MDSFTRLLVTSGIAATALFTQPAHAVLFTFTGTDKDGTGSATVDVSIVGNTLTAIITNTSPITLNALPAGTNAPALLGFGFNFVDPFDASAFTSWSLVAKTIASGGTIDTTVADGAGGVADLWTLFTNDANNQGINLDLNPDQGLGIFNGLFNPALGAAFNPPGPGIAGFFTQATFTITYGSALPALAVEPSGSGLTTSTFVRFQNVGRDGDGSLKLPGTPGTPVPEPGILGLIGVGLLGLGLALHRRRPSLRGLLVPAEARPV